MKYILDSSVLIEANNRYYGMDFCPAFWDFILDLNKKGKLFLIDKSVQTISNIDERIKIWIKNNGTEYILKTDEMDSIKIKELTTYIKGINCQDHIKKDFLNSDSFYLFAYILSNKEDYILISFENLNPYATNIKLPNLCKYFKITYTSIYQFLRDEKALFVLGSK